MNRPATGLSEATPAPTAAPVLAWHGDAQLRAAAVDRMRVHAAADALIQTTYVSFDEAAPGGYRGCFYGCLVAEIDPHVLGPVVYGVAGDRFCEPADGWQQAAQRLLGLSVRFGKTTESIFEHLRKPAAPGFAVAITEAITPGVDLDRVLDEWMVRVLTHPTGPASVASPAGQALIADAVALLRRRLDGDEPADADWGAVRMAAHVERDLRYPGDPTNWPQWLAWSQGRSAVAAALMMCWPNRKDFPESATYEASAAMSTTSSDEDGYVAYQWLADLLLEVTAAAVPAGSS